MMPRAPRAPSSALRCDVPSLIIASALALVSVGLAAQAPAPPTDAAVIDAFVRDYQARIGVPGVAIAVTRGNDVVSVTGFGRDARGQVMTADTPLPIASLSKSFTALAVMQLVERDMIQLDAPVRDYLPDFALADPRSAAITIRQLLNHTSGMSDATFRDKSGPLPASLSAGVQMLRTAPLAAPPGERARYHNPNYWVAARIVEVIGGEPFDSYLRRHIFEPLAMYRTRTAGLLTQTPDVARGYVRVYGVPVPMPEPAWFLDGASGVVSTATDMAQWLMFHNRGGVTADGTRLVSVAHLQEMHHGLGWNTKDVAGVRQTSHTGWLFTFTAHQILLEQSGYGIAVVSNVGLGLSPVESQEIAAALADLAVGRPVATAAHVALIVNVVLAALTALSAAFGVRAIRRASSWCQRRGTRSAWRNLLALLPQLMPLAILLALPQILSAVFGGRDASWLQLAYVAPALLGLLTVATVAGLAVIVARVRQLRRGGPRSQRAWSPPGLAKR